MKYFTLIFNKKSAYTIITTFIVIIGSWIAIQYAKGEFRISDRNQLLTGTGLLSVSSLPNASQIFIDEKLVGITNETIYLEPDEYQIELKKEGYRSWKKKVMLEKTLVTQINARLFPIAPSLSTLTLSGVKNLVPSPDGKKIIYYSDGHALSQKNGLYILTLADSRFSLQDGPWQLAEDHPNFDLENAYFIWSPDSSEIMMLDNERELLLNANQKNNLSNLPSISFQKKRILSEWQKEIYLREQQFLKEFPKEIQQIATQSAVNVYLSPDKKKLVYTPFLDQTLPQSIVSKALPTPTTKTDDRELKIGNIYVYDREEDRNYLITKSDESFIETIKTYNSLADFIQAHHNLEIPNEYSSLPKNKELEDQQEITILQQPKIMLASVVSDEDKSENNDQVTENNDQATENNDQATENEQSKNNQDSTLFADLSQELSFNINLTASDSAQTWYNFMSYHTPLFSHGLQWFPDSNHLLYIKEKTVRIIEFDGGNDTPLYSGPFVDTFVYPWADGNRLLIKTALSHDAPTNLYGLELR